MYATISAILAESSEAVPANKGHATKYKSYIMFVMNNFFGTIFEIFLLSFMFVKEIRSFDVIFLLKNAINFRSKYFYVVFFCP